ncbi:uncharacterized protein [Palaemon carinicauda]|uniref:uncharacterized protein n=1 Tax=Palaemon carinicauda TaxID=392227 RepID=UPI0035B57561
MVPDKRSIYHHMKIMGPKIFARFRRLAPARLATIKQRFAKMEEKGFCQNTSSQLSSPLHIIMKKYSSLCPCGDLKHLNMQPELDQYPLPYITKVTYLHKKKFSPCSTSSKSIIRGTPLSPTHHARTPTTELLVVQYDKCIFSANETLFLVHRITHEGVHTLPEKVAAIENFPTISTVKALQEFLGMANYYHHYCQPSPPLLPPYMPLSRARQKT